MKTIMTGVCRDLKGGGHVL